jgi:diguanylate cyclase (GGDEF)-like protein/PAS domain S-box-containing protein
MLSIDNERGLFQAILDNAPIGIWMVDVHGKVQFVNRGFCASTGITEAQFLAAGHYADVMPASVAEGCLRSDRECLEQDTPHLSSEWLPFVDGREHLLEITKVRLHHDDGSIRGIIGLAADITERSEHEQQLKRMAHFDALTGVPNRVLLADRLVQALARTKRDKGLMAVCYLDLDGFKPVNDRFGHGTGDKLLVEITRRIKEAVREDDTVARLGGDEFVVLLVGLQVPEECVGSLQRLLESIKQPIAVNDTVLSISASIGVALYPDDEEDADTLLRHADQAMYVAKAAGKNRYHLFDPASDQRARSHDALLQQIRHGLAQGEFELYYQPKVEMRTRRLVGAEALLRWNHPQRGCLLPEDFLRAVENTELEIELGEWVIGSALDQRRQWRRAAFEIELSINISAYHLQSPGFVQKLKQCALERGPLKDLRGLQIEVLETAALDDIARISGLIKACRELGVGFALDDFGTGYSSLTYLSKLDVDTLKIDQSFVRDMQDDKGDYAVVHGIIALARAFDMNIVAEGVENEALYQALLEMGCEVGQGHGIGQPMPAGELVNWCLRRMAKA